MPAQPGGRKRAAAGNMTGQFDATKTMAKEMAYDQYNRIRQVTDPSTGMVKDRYSFELSEEEFENLICQIGTSSWGGTRYMPMAFTEQGVAMLSSVLNSGRAIKVNIQIMRAFTQLRQMILSHDDVRRKIEAVEEKYDKQFRIVFEAIKELLRIESNPKKRIGFRVKDH